MGFTYDDNSRSLLLSDCTKGLVGGFKTKLDDKDEDTEGARDRAPKSVSSLSADGNRGSSWKGGKFRGGDVESHSCRSELYKIEFAPKSL